MIAQEQYFTQRVRQEQVLPQFFRQDLAKKFDYVVPSIEDVENVCKVIIPQEIEQRYIVSSIVTNSRKQDLMYKSLE